MCGAETRTDKLELLLPELFSSEVLRTFWELRNCGDLAGLSSYVRVVIYSQVTYAGNSVTKFAGHSPDYGLPCVCSRKNWSLFFVT